MRKIKYNDYTMIVYRGIYRCNDNVWQKCLFKLFLTYKAVTYRLESWKILQWSAVPFTPKLDKLMKKLIFFPRL